MRSLTEYARGGTTYARTHPSALPKSLSVVSRRDSEDYRELVRAASVRSMGHVNETQMLKTQIRMESRGINKSCSVVMGRIDEEKDGDLSEDGVGVGVGGCVHGRSKSPYLYVRSRTITQ